MNKDIEKLDKIMTGAVPYNFSTLSACEETNNNRKTMEYSWLDIVLNQNDAPLMTDTAIIVTAWYGQLGWLKATLASYRRTGAFVILAFDNQFAIWDDKDNPDYILRCGLRPIHHLLAHAVVVKHRTFDADKRTCWWWSTRYAQAILKDFPNIKYIYETNGDCIIEKPEGLDKIKELLGSGDFISGQSMVNGVIHTADVFYKAEAFYKVVDYMKERNKVTVLQAHSPECMLKDAVKVLKLKEVLAPKQPIDTDGSIDFYCRTGSDSTWKDILGFRNLFAEQEYRENNGLEPLDSKYYDPFMNWLYWPSYIRESLCKYFETKDRRYLMMYWDQGKESDYERQYHPLDYYGKDPIWA
jgi:hypothetical protein